MSTFEKIKKTEVRQMQTSDIEAVMEIKNAENWNQSEEDWHFLINSNLETCLVAVFENQVMGTVTAINYQNKVAWIGMMLVAKDFRGIGVSKLLLDTIIKKLKSCVSIKLDATPAGIPVYKKLGFVVEYEICRMVSKRLSNTYKDQQSEPSANLSQISESDISKVARLDETFFGVNRLGLFRYLSNNRKEISLQINQGVQLKGYVFGRNGSNYIQVGPVIADSTQLAKKLLSGAFEKLKEQPIVVDVLLNKSELKEWLLSIGFTHQRSFTRMYLKSNDYAGKVENQYAITGPELG